MKGFYYENYKKSGIKVLPSKFPIGTNVKVAISGTKGKVVDITRSAGDTENAYLVGYKQGGYYREDWFTESVLRRY